MRLKGAKNVKRKNLPMALSNACNLCLFIWLARPLHASKAKGIDFFHGVQEIIESSDGLYFGESAFLVQIVGSGVMQFIFGIYEILAIALRKFACDIHAIHVENCITWFNPTSEQRTFLVRGSNVVVVKVGHIGTF